MVRTPARCTRQPFHIGNGGARHREAPLRPRGAPALRAAALALALALARGPEAGGAERSFPPPAGTPFEIARPELLGPPGETLPRPADLALVFYDPQGVLPRGFEGFAAEVQAIFRGLGVEASWRVGGTYGGSAIPEVPLILLARDPVEGRRGTRIMGLVMRDQTPQRAVWLFLNAVRFSLGYPQGEAGGDVGSVARALARVAAHEIVHAVAPDEPHAADGLMRHSLDKRFLLGRRATIDARCAASFRTRLLDEWRQLLARAPTATPTQPVLP